MPHEHTALLHDEERDEQSSSSTTLDEPTPIPWRSLFVILLLTTTQPLAFEIIFPFVNQMIVEIGVVTDPERVGFYSGVIESIFSCMSFIAIMPASYLADWIGRKPVILGGVTGLAISVASFGMSKSFLAMVLSRCVGGALGSTWACCKIMVGESTDRSNQAVAFQWLSIAYRAGQMIGLPLGGLLAHPTRNFPAFQTKFWYEYPFALPCFVASITAISSVIMAYFCLEETLPSKKKKQTRELTYGTMSPPDDETSDPPTPTENEAAAVVCSPEQVKRPAIKSVLTPSIISLLVSNVAMCLASEVVFSVFPLFAFTPVISGGMGLSEAQIGTQMAIRALLVIGTTSFYSPLERWFGSAVRLYYAVMWMWPLTILCMPLLNYLARDKENPWSLYLALAVFFFVWSAGSFAWTSMSIMITDATPSASALAAINGLSQMAIVLPQAIAPASVTSLFAISIKSGIAGGNLIWIILFIFTCTAAVHSMTLREPTTDWRQEVQDL